MERQGKLALYLQRVNPAQSTTFMQRDPAMQAPLTSCRSGE